MSEETPFAGFVRPEKNYFPMPNEWINICAQIDNLAELKVIQYVLRHTWGYQEYGITKTITVEEFMHGRKRNDGSRMDEGTGLKSDRSVKDGIKQALKHGYLICEIDKTDLARIKKSYALKMVSTEGYNLPLDRQVNTTPQNGQVVSTCQGGRYYPSEVQNLPLGGTKSTPRSEKDTLERHSKKDTLENDAPTPLFPENRWRKETDPTLPAIKTGTDENDYHSYSPSLTIGDDSRASDEKVVELRTASGRLIRMRGGAFNQQNDSQQSLASDAIQAATSKGDDHANDDTRGHGDLSRGLLHGDDPHGDLSGIRQGEQGGRAEGLDDTVKAPAIRLPKQGAVGHEETHTELPGRYPDRDGDRLPGERANDAVAGHGYSGMVCGSASGDSGGTSVHTEQGVRTHATLLPDNSVTLLQPDLPPGSDCGAAASASNSLLHRLEDTSGQKPGTGLLPLAVSTDVTDRHGEAASIQANPVSRPPAPPLDVPPVIAATPVARDSLDNHPQADPTVASPAVQLVASDPVQDAAQAIPLGSSPPVTTYGAVQASGANVHKTSTDEPPPVMALSAKQIKAQIERRTKELWVIIERERKTKYTRGQRELYENSKGIEYLITDDISDEALTTALKAMDLYQQRQFNVLKFYGWLPNLTAAQAPAPAQNGQSKPTIVNKAAPAQKLNALPIFDEAAYQRLKETPA